MLRRGRLLFVLACLFSLALAPPALAGHGAEPTSKDMRHLANSSNPGVTNSDLAFWQELAFAGDYKGFRILDISSPSKPRVLANVRCNGSQGDVGVYGDDDTILAFQSVDRRQTTNDCTSSDDQTRTLGWEGIRIFDVSNPRRPFHVKSVATDCGSHTHTVVPDPDNDRVFVYVSSYPLNDHGMHSHDHEDDGQTTECLPMHHKISVIEVPLDNPQQAKVVSQPSVAPATGCHDIGVFLEIKRAAAACLTEGQIWDLSDLANPKVLHHIYNPAVNIWHSGGFTWDGKVAIFGDEEGGAVATHGCGVSPPGATWFYRPENPQFPLGYFEQQRAQLPEGDLLCTTHNYNSIPTTSGYFFTSAFYEAGTGIVDFNAVKDREPSPSPSPVGEEIAWYDAENADSRGEANTWSSYWYKDHVFGNDINRGVDVFKYTGTRIEGARAMHHLNPQTQERMLVGNG